MEGHQHGSRWMFCMVLAACATSSACTGAAPQLKARPPHDAFKRIAPAQDIKLTGKLRTSEQRRIRALLKEQYPLAVEALDKGTLWSSGAWDRSCSAGDGGEWLIQTAKAAHKMQLLLVADRPLFFREGDDGFIFPSLRLVHCFPELLPTCRVDTGAIKHVISGAIIMAPGISQMDEVPEGGAVSIFADGKKYALAIGVLLKNSDDILADKKGPAVEVLHRLTDGLWQIRNLQH